MDEAAAARFEGLVFRSRSEDVEADDEGPDGG
jgi:hypothetical protein